MKKSINIILVLLAIGAIYLHFSVRSEYGSQIENNHFTSQKWSGEIIDAGVFVVEYSEQLEQPLWLKYQVLCPSKGIDRSGMDFRTVSYMKTSSIEDYENNDWDRGHLAPSASFDCNRDTLMKVYTYLNCALQHKSLNRGAWSRLESFERDLAKIYDRVEVEVECHFSDTSIKLLTGATVPDAFTKRVKFDDRVISTYFINRQTNSNDWGDYIIE